MRRICPASKTSVAPTVTPDHDMTWGKPNIYSNAFINTMLLTDFCV